MNMLFAEALQLFHQGRETGALFVSVVQSKEYLVRFWFENGQIHHVSYGPLRGRECLELLDCYDFGKAVFFTGMKRPKRSDSTTPGTPGVIKELLRTGKTIQSITRSGTSAAAAS